jgi:hypothetical protein
MLSLDLGPNATWHLSGAGRTADGGETRGSAETSCSKSASPDRTSAWTLT